MNNTILFCDPLSYDGHIKFNTIHIRSLKSSGWDVKGVFKEGYANKLGLSPKDIAFEIPSELFKFNGPISFRISLIKILKYIKRNIVIGRFDKIIMSSYDGAAQILSNFPSCYLINHNNITNNFMKTWCLKYLGKYNTHITLLTESKNYIKGIGCKNVEYVSHGLMPALNVNDKYKSKYSYSIFVPSASSSDVRFLSELVALNKFLHFIKKENIELIIRTNSLLSEHPNIRILTKRIDDEMYNALIANSTFILLAYPDNFIHRVSGVLMEAISSKKVVLMKDIYAMRQFEKLFPRQCYFKDIDGLIESIQYFITNDILNIPITNSQIDDLTPDYTFLLKH